ncbi:MAG TPA: 30S ribosomal protein S6 [Phycisphaerae bacterium]|nr:30S ribosomal protein S6 [Phycisphaerae bacterium]
MKTYEAMFVLDASGTNFEEAAAPVRDVLARSEAETLAMKPWDERRLAYEIKGHRRGLYVLTYFKADPTRMEAMEHDIQLDERILRAMILSADHLDEKAIHAETPATSAQARKAAREAEGAEPAETRESKRDEKAEQDRPRRGPGPRARTSSRSDESFDSEESEDSDD